MQYFVLQRSGLHVAVGYILCFNSLSFSVGPLFKATIQSVSLFIQIIPITCNVKDALIFLFHVIRILLEDPRTSVDTAEKKGHTALHIAALKGNYEIMEVLLDMTTVDVNAADEAGCTALHIAGLQDVLHVGVAFKSKS
jgi:ankyrin repeat protein